MAMHIYGNGTTTTTHGTNTDLHFLDRVGIEAASTVNTYCQFASRKEMPTKYGKTYKIHRWQRIYDRDFGSADFAKYGFIASRDIADVSAGLNSLLLPEGTTSRPGLELRRIVLETSLNRYGAELDYTDEVELFDNDYMQVRYRKELGEHANQTYEDLIQLDMLSTNNIMYSGLGTSLATMGTGVVAAGTTDSAYTVNYDLIQKAVDKLSRNQAKPVTELVKGSTKIDTRVVGAAYYAIIGHEVYQDLLSVQRGTGAAEQLAFKPIESYADASKIADGEVGSMGNVRFILSPSAVIYRGAGATVPAGYVGDLKETGGNFDVFPILFPTKDSFATVGLKGNKKIIFNSKSPAQVDSGNRFGTIGWFTYNFWYASIILQEEKLLKLLVLSKG